MFHQPIITSDIENIEIEKHTMIDEYPAEFSFFITILLVGCLRFLSWSENAI